MCAWCETSLSDPFRRGVPRQAHTRSFSVNQRETADNVPYGAHDPVDRWVASIGNVVVITTLICILVVCPIAVTLLLHKQEAVDNAGTYYRGPSSHPSSEFPGYGALSIIPSLTFALAVYLLFRWITRKRRDYW